MFTQFGLQLRLLKYNNSFADILVRVVVTSNARTTTVVKIIGLVFHVKNGFLFLRNKNTTRFACFYFTPSFIYNLSYTWDTYVWDVLNMVPPSKTLRTTFLKYLKLQNFATELRMERSDLANRFPWNICLSKKADSFRLAR